MRSGPMFRWISPEIVDPNVFSCSEPIQIRYLYVINENMRTPHDQKFLPVWALCKYLRAKSLCVVIGRTCRHVESAAPIPVPVHTRMPLRYSVEEFETPANYIHVLNDITMVRRCCDVPSVPGSRDVSAGRGRASE